MSKTYEQAKEDHEYLWSIGEAYDMSGGYVDQDDLDSLLKNPTKATARSCFIRQIGHCFEAALEGNGSSHRDMYMGPGWHVILNDSRVNEIYKRYL